MSDWLNNFGYAKTLALFNQATYTTCKENPEILEERRQIMQLINGGRVSEAIRRTNALAPQVLQNNKHLSLQLKIQEFTELFALITSGNLERFDEYMEANSLNESLVPEEAMSPDAPASTSAQSTPTSRHKRPVPECSHQSEVKHRPNQTHENRFTSTPRRSARSTQQNQPVQHQSSAAVEDSQNGFQAEGSQHQTNGHVVEDRSTNGLATNGNADYLSATNGTTPPTSTNIITEIDEDNYSYSSEFSNSSAESSEDWEMDNAETNKRDELGFPDKQILALINIGQKISVFASKIRDVPSELLQRMDVRIVFTPD